MIFGLIWFPYVTASLVSIFFMVLVISMAYAFGWMNELWSTLLIILLGLPISVLIGIVVRKSIWLMICLLGIVCGFFGGTFLFAFISYLSGWEAEWGYWVISCLVASIGGVLAFYLGKTFVIYATGLSGAYLFTRAWTMYFPGHWPETAAFLEGDAQGMQTDGVFWAFIAVLVVCSVSSVILQIKMDAAHEELDSYK